METVWTPPLDPLRIPLFSPSFKSVDLLVWQSRYFAPPAKSLDHGSRSKPRVRTPPFRDVQPRLGASCEEIVLSSGPVSWPSRR